MEIHRKIFKNLLQNHLAQMLEIYCLVDLYQVCSNGGPGVKNGSAAGGLGFKIKYT